MRTVLPAIPSDLTVAASPLEALPPIVDSAVLAARVADSIAVERIDETTTALGWPCTIARGSRGDTSVLRVIVRMLDHGVLVEASAPDPDARERAWDLVAQIRPDWSSELAAIHQLFT